MMETQKPVLIAQQKEQPFKIELFSKDCSFDLIRAANHKTYKQFIRDCQNPDLLLEVLLVKRNEAHFPSIKQINRIYRLASFWGFVIKLFAGKKASNDLKCAVYRSYIPKQQYAH